MARCIVQVPSRAGSRFYRNGFPHISRIMHLVDHHSQAPYQTSERRLSLSRCTRTIPCLIIPPPSTATSKQKIMKKASFAPSSLKIALMALRSRLFLLHHTNNISNESASHDQHRYHNDHHGFTSTMWVYLRWLFGTLGDSA